MTREPGRVPPPRKPSGLVPQGLRLGPVSFLGAACRPAGRGMCSRALDRGELRVRSHCPVPIALAPSVSRLHTAGGGRLGPATSGPPMTPRCKAMVPSVVTVRRSLGSHSPVVDEEGSCSFLLFFPVRCLSLVSFLLLTLRHQQVDLPRPSCPAASFCVSACVVAGGPGA